MVKVTYTFLYGICHPPIEGLNGLWFSVRRVSVLVGMAIWRLC